MQEVVSVNSDMVKGGKEGRKMSQELIKAL
jgi:hypothetical protein